MLQRTFRFFSFFLAVCWTHTNLAAGTFVLSIRYTCCFFSWQFAPRQQYWSFDQMLFYRFHFSQSWNCGEEEGKNLNDTTAYGKCVQIESHKKGKYDSIEWLLPIWWNLWCAFCERKRRKTWRGIPFIFPHTLCLLTSACVDILMLHRIGCRHGFNHPSRSKETGMQSADTKRLSNSRLREMQQPEIVISNWFGWEALGVFLREIKWPSVMI